ncbi:MAG: CARDB domain-containing protein, partial [Opitutales bacterium]
MDSIGFDWPYPMDWLWLGSAVLVFLFALHARSLFLSLPFHSAIRLFVLRSLGGIFFFSLISRPFIDRFEQDPKSVRILSLVDLSGSMHQKDEDGSGRRIEQVRAHMDVNSATSWINQARSRYGAVERLGFTDGELFAIRSSSWEIPEKGENTSIGNALANVLRSSEQEKPAALVLFSDGRSNTGMSALEVAKDFREVGIPVNVVGVGKFKESGNLSVEFVEAPREVMAKEELTLSAGIKNGFDQEKVTSVSLFADEHELEKLSVQLQPGELRTVRFSSFTPEVSGLFTYRVVIDSVDGDSDRSDDQDTQLIKVKPPAYFSVLYLSNQVRPLYPFLKRTLSGEQFQLSSLIRLGEQTFHARGELVSPEGYPTEEDFWMDYDVVLLDADCLTELNATLVSSLKNFVQKRGGGLLMFGNPQISKSLLGGLMPGLETEASRAKDNRSLIILSDPLFTERKRMDDWKPFLPAGMPVELITRLNPAARGVVQLRGNASDSVLGIQAYGAGKSAYWGSPHDWRRSLVDEQQAKEFSIFWTGVVQWLGSGKVERIKAVQPEDESKAGDPYPLAIDALGSGFQPSLDAVIEANITGP